MSGRLGTDSLDGPLFALGAIGAAFTVTDPPELVTMAAEWGSRFDQGSGDTPYDLRANIQADVEGVSCTF